MRSWAVPEPARLPGRGLPLRVWDTATGTVHPTPAGPVATLYVCGITPYDATHLGHAATYVAFDVLQRVWRDAGYAVRYVQNVTDVDDPLLERASRDHVDWAELAEREIERFRADMTALRVLPPTDYVGAVEALPQIIGLIGELVAAGAAYDCDGDLYFSVAAAPYFGAVAGLDRSTMVALSRERGGDPDRGGKKDPLDCLLWQSGRPGEPAWDSPYGAGRPGWHVECAAIALDRIGPTVDVQGGGSDLAFPHHELGASEAQVATGVWPVARSFVHTGMVGLDGEKMSKSRGNLVFVSALRADGVDPMAIRLALLAHHYRRDWDWTPDNLIVARARLARWRTAVGRPAGPPAAPVLERVRERLADDLDAPAAVYAVDRWADETLASGGQDDDAPTLVRALADALLGVVL